VKSEFRGVVLEWGVATEVGRVRSLNEDSVLAEPPVFAVADGMGGHDAGEVASALAIERLASLIANVPPEVDAVANELQKINELLKSASVGGQPVDMGTTVVALIVASNNGVPGWLIANIGDSRAYCVADGSFGQLTSDHSYVQELVDAGQINAAEARRHPDRNVVTQALGVVELARPDFWVRPFKAGERFLLCSDGLTGELEDVEIADVLLTEGNPTVAVGILMERALAAGGRDNVTIVVVDVVATPALVDESTETRPKRKKATKVVAGPQPTDLQATDLNLGAPKGVPPKGVAPNVAAPKGAAQNLVAPKLADRPVMPTSDLSAEAIEIVPLDAIAGAGELLPVDQPAGGELIAGAPVPFEEPDEQEPQQVMSAVPLVEMITGGPPSSDAGEVEDEGSGDRDG